MAKLGGFVNHIIPMNDPTFRKPELTVIERARYLTGPERPETNPSYAEWREIVEGLLALMSDSRARGR